MTMNSYEGAGNFSYHYPFLAVIITSHAGDKENAMAAAWHAPISMNPPLYGVSLATNRFSYKLIIASGEFGINFMPLKSAKIIAAVGGSKGSEIDKFKKFNIEKEQLLKTSVPVLKDAYLVYECKLYDHKLWGDHNWLVGEIVAVHKDSKCFTENDQLNLQEIEPAIYIGGDRYTTATNTSICHIQRKYYVKKD
ncbi:MAG: flavin reductase family protein [Chloroflexi bacterium]|nr:flavin reductase family protein [Chloroflexota bacterium]